MQKVVEFSTIDQEEHEITIANKSEIIEIESIQGIEIGSIGNNTSVQ